MWSRCVEEPFKDDPAFWSSVGASVDALVTLLAVAALVAVAGPVAAVAFAVPLALLVLAAVRGHASTARTKPAFASRTDWRNAERRAVAAALPGALLRRRRLLPRAGATRNA